MLRTVLGLDLGHTLGYGVIREADDGSSTLLAFGAIKVAPRYPQPTLNALASLAAEHAVTDVGYEAVDFSVSRQQTEAHAAIRELVYVASERAKVRCHEVPVAWAKKAATGGGMATKSQVAKALSIRYGVKLKTGDAADACAVAHAVVMDAQRQTWSYADEAQEEAKSSPQAEDTPKRTRRRHRPATKA